MQFYFRCFLFKQDNSRDYRKYRLNNKIIYIFVYNIKQENTNRTNINK